MKIAVLAHPITLFNNKTKWISWGELHYDFDRDGGWQSIVVQRYGRIYTGTFVAKFDVPADANVVPPFVEGDIMTCTSKTGTPSRIGRIYTSLDDNGNFKDYRGMIDSCVPLLGPASENGNYVFPIFVE